MMTGRPVVEYRHKSLGTVASFGIGKGAGIVKGIKLKNVPAWLAHRGYHLYAMPTTNRKMRILAGWMTNLIAGGDTTPIVGHSNPRASFLEATSVVAKQK
jgi:NADH dehydrogenase